MGLKIVKLRWYQIQDYIIQLIKKDHAHIPLNTTKYREVLNALLYIKIVIFV
ncbi:hypothetical protein MNB_SV-6-97 [hydrothermal vent metagenome]|uniref:Uncharacterized protein n=1 Tax=hydrothermal vent metagenome TaxID=652676 RepID=A0A1W1BKE0_9ZZZZ